MTQLITIIVILMMWVVIEMIRNSKLEAHNDKLYLRALKAESRLEYIDGRKLVGKVENKIDRKV